MSSLAAARTGRAMTIVAPVTAYFGWATINLKWPYMMMVHNPNGTWGGNAWWMALWESPISLLALFGVTIIVGFIGLGLSELGKWIWAGSDEHERKRQEIHRKKMDLYNEKNAISPSSVVQSNDGPHYMADDYETDVYGSVRYHQEYDHRGIPHYSAGTSSYESQS